MHTRTKLVKVGLAILFFLGLTLFSYFVLINKFSKTQVVTTLSPKEDAVAKIGFSGNWQTAKFPEGYHHSINIMFPATWQLDCCADTDSFSLHTIFPPSSVDSKLNPSIFITDYTLVSCPKDNPDCSLEQVQKVSPGQYLAKKIQEFDANPKFIKKSPAKLRNFSNNASVYYGYDADNRPVEEYLIQTPNGVVKIEFQQAQKFESIFKTEFLNKLRAN